MFYVHVLRDYSIPKTKNLVVPELSRKNLFIVWKAMWKPSKYVILELGSVVATFELLVVLRRSDYRILLSSLLRWFTSSFFRTVAMRISFTYLLILLFSNFKIIIKEVIIIQRLNQIKTCDYEVRGNFKEQFRCQVSIYFDFLGPSSN